MSKRVPELLVQDMVLAIEAINRYCHGLTFREFKSDQKTVDAVLRNFTVLGEAANRIPPPYAEANNKIEWVKIARSRHIIVHDYFGVDLEILWNIIENHLPNTLAELKMLIPPAEI
jgi:uncharacterized protein with HEPN domain